MRCCVNNTCDYKRRKVNKKIAPMVGVIVAILKKVKRKRELELEREIRTKTYYHLIHL